MTVIWSNRAFLTYDKVIDDLLIEWNPDIAEDFENRTRKLLDNLKVHSKLCPASKFKTLRKCVIHKNVSMVYKLQGKSKINIVAFIRSQSNHHF
jgi:plasmid stabilization system protein ParE